MNAIAEEYNVTQLRMALDIMENVEVLFSEPARYCTGFFAKTITDQFTTTLDPSAAKWNYMGAIGRVSGQELDKCYLRSLIRQYYLHATVTLQYADMKDAGYFLQSATHEQFTEVLCVSMELLRSDINAKDSSSN